MAAGTGGAIRVSTISARTPRKSQRSGPWPSTLPWIPPHKADAPMRSAKDKLYTLAKRLSIGRVLRYVDLWARYGWRRVGSAFGSRAPAAGKDTEALAATLAGAEFATAKRL